MPPSHPFQPPVDPGTVPAFLPDLTLYHSTHLASQSLPPRWQGLSMAEISHDLGLPAWQLVRPWEMRTPGVEIREIRTDGERTTEIVTPVGTLTSRWSAGSDGTWWQLEYPVKAASDLDAALAWANARTYELRPGVLTALDAVADGDVLAMEAPTRPYADLLYDLMGMGEGYMLLLEAPPAMLELLAVLEEKLQSFVGQLASLGPDIVYSPDNLDGQFIPPPTFAEHFVPSYQRSTEILHQADKQLIVHAGGPVSRLLEPLAAAGVDGVEGVAPPPQGDASIAQARPQAGSSMLFWGGIPQDYVLATRSDAEFEAAVTAAAGEAAKDPRTVLGIADRIPAEADLDRIRAIPGLIAAACGS
jgi:hypothetical protein